MSLRKAYAAALMQLRLSLDRSQHDAAGKIDHSHVSRLETGKHSATVTTSAAIAEALGVKPLSFLALVFSAKEERPAREVLLEALAELEALELAEVVLPSEPSQISVQDLGQADKRWVAVQAHKKAGATQKETAVALGLPATTVWRLWRKTYE
jgi:transcriptional regulator with XRE-family HTH domain